MCAIILPTYGSIMKWLYMFHKYFQNQTVPVLSRNYTNTIAPTIFNYKKALQNFDHKEWLQNHIKCSVPILLSTVTHLDML